MNKFSPIFAATAFAVFACSAFAATDTKTIDIEVIQGTFAELTGSAVDGNINNINLNDITASNTTSLGALGVNSNGSNCAIEFSTLNNFRFNHESSGATLKTYFLNYLGTNIFSNADVNRNIALDSCAIAPSALTITPSGDTLETIEAGTYKDTVTITLTAE
ncbi:hypothetical protein EOL70_10810 [Leucothrix sargassi]|nr:hypothetical protein EOL70_10810 [Leucothrix sargassi]